MGCPYSRAAESVNSRKLSFRQAGFSETELPEIRILGNRVSGTCHSLTTVHLLQPLCNAAQPRSARAIGPGLSYQSPSDSRESEGLQGSLYGSDFKDAISQQLYLKDWLQHSGATFTLDTPGSFLSLSMSRYTHGRPLPSKPTTRAHRLELNPRAYWPRRLAHNHCMLNGAGHVALLSLRIYTYTCVRIL